MNKRPIKTLPAELSLFLHIAALLVLSLMAAVPIFADKRRPQPAPEDLTGFGGEPVPRESAERTGSVLTSEGLTLHLNTDLGSVKIIPLETGAAPVVRYTVRLETDTAGSAGRRLLDRYSLNARTTSYGVEITGNLPQTLARSANAGPQYWVQFEVAVPKTFSVEVKTEVGDIETGNIGGTAYLSTLGGNIRTGNIGTSSVHVGSGTPVAKLETDGGNIQVENVSGDLTAFTAGGHINARDISGDASLHSGGGHIRAGQIGGRADLQTDGGNITVGQAGNLVSVRTGGGQIDFGEVRGSVRAQTGGGGIRIMYASGPMEVESSAGSICLTRVAGTMKAATAGGTITAWINPDSPSSGGTVHLAGLSQLSSGTGDIVVFLPRNLAANIDAEVESGGDQRIEADPALALTIETPRRGNGPLRAFGALNGGGAPLKLRSNAGKIKLRYVDSDIALRDSLIREQKERIGQLASFKWEHSESTETAEERPEAADADWFDRWLGKLEQLLATEHQDPEEFRKHLIAQPSPCYPELAKRARVQGTVRLQVRAMRDGRVEVERILDGSPILADAAIAAVKLWRVKPFTANGKPIEVISSVSFNFQLNR